MLSYLQIPPLGMEYTVVIWLFYVFKTLLTLQESKSVPNSTLSGMDIKKMKEDTLRNIQMRMEAARAENEMASLSMSQRFSKGGKKMILRPDSQEERRERANRRETRYAKELRARKFRELQFEMQQNLPPPNLGTRTPNSVSEWRK